MEKVEWRRLNGEWMQVEWKNVKSQKAEATFATLRCISKELTMLTTTNVSTSKMHRKLQWGKW